MNISDTIKLAKEKLSAELVESAALDSLLMICHAIKATKEEVIFNQSRELTKKELSDFWELVDLRCKRQPISQILGTKEFFSNEFVVTKDVLTPRPDSEALIDLVCSTIKNRQKELDILEIGVGSGCLIATILMIYKNSTGLGIDISPDACGIAEKNFHAYGLNSRVSIKDCNMENFETDKKFDVIISNPPYIKSKDIEFLEPEVKDHEPRIALDGGEDGLKFYRIIAIEFYDKLKDDGVLVLEVGDDQSEDVIKIFEKNKFRFVDKRKDLSGITRSLCFSR